jgi:hypothetical protein
VHRLLLILGLTYSLIGQHINLIGQHSAVLTYRSFSYPDLARQARITGQVILRFSTSNGVAQNIELISGHPLLVQAAKESLGTWTFAKKVDLSTPAPQTFTFHFEFHEESKNREYHEEEELFVLESSQSARIRTDREHTVNTADCPDRPAPAVKSVAVTDFAKLTRVGCEGDCAAYQVTIYGDGRVDWTGQQRVHMQGTHSYQIDGALAQSALLSFGSPEVQGLCRGYFTGAKASPSTELETNLGGVQRTVRQISSAAPAWFRHLLLKFERAVETHRMRHGNALTEALAYIDKEDFSKPGFTELMQAAKEGDLFELKNLLAQGVKVNQVDASGWTALMYAAGSFVGRPVIDALLSAGADAQHKSPYGDTVLMANAMAGAIDERILSRTFRSINAQNKDGVTVLMILAARGGPKQIRSVIRVGADPRIKDRHGKTALDYLEANLCGKTLLRGDWRQSTPFSPCKADGPGGLEMREALKSSRF